MFSSFARFVFWNTCAKRLVSIFFIAGCMFNATTAADAQAATRTTLAIPTDFALNMIQGSDGSLYSTSGTPNEGCQDNNNNQCSFIYRIAPDGSLSVFHAFQEVSGTPVSGSSYVTNADGLQPSAFFEGADGNFYGACESGGADGLGTIFSIRPDGTFRVLYSFPIAPAFGGPINGAAPNSLIQGADGNFYGTSKNGSTNGGGDSGGMFFQVTPGGTLTVLNYFTYVSDPVTGVPIYPKGGGPTSIVQGDNGDFYISMFIGPGAQTSPRPNLGAIDEVTASGEPTVLFTFPADGSDGFPSIAPLVEGSDGAFYGTTDVPLNNTSKYPALAYRLSQSGNFTQLYQFTGGTDGDPVNNGGLFLGSDLNFYGVTNNGGNLTGAYCTATNGPPGCGTFFRLQPSGTLTTLYTFAGGVSSPTTGIAAADGAHPFNPITQGPGGVFYGITVGGGTTAASVSYPTVYSLALTQPIPSPVQLSFSVNGQAVSSVNPNTPVLITWNVLNAFSQTAQQCHASVLGNPPGAGNWGGPQTGSLKGNVFTGTATITPALPGSFTYVLNCGGVEIGKATLTVSGVTILTAALPDGMVSVPYLAIVEAIGGVLPYSWGSSSLLPPGLSLQSTVTTTTINLAGTPTQFGKYTVDLGVQDASNQLGLKSFTFNIASGLVLVPSLNNGTVGTAYNVFATATGGLPPYKWALTSGKLPPGLTLTAGNGAISGTPTVVGTYTFSITASDAEVTPATVTQSYTVSTVAPPLAIVQVPMINCTVNVLCQGQFQATGGTPPYTFSVPNTSGFPPAVTLASNGSYTGIPMQFNCVPGSQPVGTFRTVLVQVTDSSTPKLQDMTVSLFCIVSGLKIVSIPLPPATFSVPYNSPAPTATGGVPPYTWYAHSNLAPQLINEYSIDPKTGIISSYPGSPTSVGTFVLNYSITDSETSPAALAQLDATLIVNPLMVPSVTTLSASNSAAGAGMPVTLTAKVTSMGSIPAGLVTFYNGTAVLGTGILDAAGTATLAISFPTSGAYSLTASYGGSGTVLGSVSAALTETVVTVGVMGTISPTSLTIASGSTGTLTVTVTPMGGYTGTVSLACGTLPANVSCTFVPPSLTLTAGGGPVTDTLTIHTSAAQSAMVFLPWSGNRVLSLGLLLWLPGSLTAVSLLFRRNRKPGYGRNLLLLAIACVGLLGAQTLVGCGRGSSANARAGTYTIPVTLTLAGGATQTVSAKVIIQ